MNSILNGIILLKIIKPLLLKQFYLFYTLRGSNKIAKLCIVTLYAAS